MEEALRLLRQAGAPAHALGRAGPPLAPALQAEIQEALLELRAEALLGYLQASACPAAGPGLPVFQLRTLCVLE